MLFDLALDFILIYHYAIFRNR